MPPFFVDIAVSALWAGSAVGFYLFCVRPQLAGRRAQTGAFMVPAISAAAVVVLLVADAFVPIPPILFVAPTVILVAVWISPDELVGMTGGPRPMGPDIEAAFARSSEAWARLDVGDVDGASAAVEELERIRTPVTDRYVALWSRFIAEEHARRSGTHTSSVSTLTEIREEASRLRTVDVRLGPRQSWAAVGLAMAMGLTPALYTARACIGVELMLPTEATEFTDAVPPFLADPEPGARLVDDVALGLEEEAASRHDPDAYRQLVDAGFVIAYHRVWQTSIGDQIEASESIFEDAAGALRFHQQVNRYACQFSNEAFAGPGDSAGLQVRYASGPQHIVEQVSWVYGAGRYVVSVGTVAAPPHHERVMNLAQRAMEEPSP